MKLKGIKDIPKRSEYTYPDGKKLKGTVIKEIGEISEDGNYYFVIQRIKLDNEEEDLIRFGYYKRKSGNDEFLYGSQTAYTAGVKFTKDLIDRAENENLFE